MRKWIEFFVDRPLVVNCLMVMVCILGGTTFAAMSRDLIPTFRSTIVRVEGRLPGASAVDCEQFLTFPIEEVVKDLPGVKHIDSRTKAGSFTVDVIFKPEHEDIQESLETVRSRIDQISFRFPTDLQPLTIQHLKQDRVDFLSIVIEPVNENDPAHRTWVKSFAEALDKIPHVVAVDSSLPAQDLYVEFDRAKVDAAGLDVDRLRQRVLEFLAYQPIGTVYSDLNAVSVELHKGFTGVEALKSLPITRNRVGAGLDLKDVAQVSLRSKDERTRTRHDGRPYIMLDVWKDTGSDIIELEAKVEKVVAEFNERAPKPLEAEVLASASFLIEQPLRVIFVNGLAGLLIVGVVLFLFLGFRIAAMAVIGLPFVYLGTFIILDYLGIEIHLVSVIGMLLVLGILVDDAILVSERFQENMQLGKDPRTSAIDSAHALFRPVLGTIVTNIVVFAPILFIKSEMSAIFYAVPCVIIATLLLSLFESFFLLPNHLQHFVPKGYAFKERRFFLVMQAAYRWFFNKALTLRYLSALLFVGLFAASIHLLIGMEKNFDLNLGSKSVFVHGRLKESASLEDALRQAKALEDIVASLPEKDIAWTFVTAGEARVPGGHRVYGVKEVELRVTVDIESEEPDTLADEVERTLAERMKSVPGFELVEVHQRRQGKDKEEDVVTIYVSGGDTLSFEQIQNEIHAKIDTLPDVEKVYVDPHRFQSSWQFEPDPSRLALYGIEHAALTRQLRQSFAPQELLRFRHRGEEMTAYTRFAHGVEYRYEELADLTIMSPKEIPVPLSKLGTWRAVQVLKQIEHQDLLRKFEIDVAYDKGQTTHDAVKEAVEAKLAPLKAAHPQYTISVKPPEAEEEAKRWMTKVMVACIGIIFLTLVFVLNSLSQPLVVMLSIPFGLAGVVFALVTHGMPLGMMAMIGLIGLTGVVVNDSLVMVDTINQRRIDGIPFRQAVLEGATSRFKAVVLTSLTTLGGVFPLAYGIGGKAGFTQPMVFTLGWGLLFATTLTLILLPCTLTIVDDARRAIFWLRVKLRRKAVSAPKLVTSDYDGSGPSPVAQ